MKALALTLACILYSGCTTIESVALNYNPTTKATEVSFKVRPKPNGKEIVALPLETP